LDVFDGNLEGAMRIDSNISLVGGERAEVKNISSHKGVEKALAYEITRQRSARRRGVAQVQETRHYDELRGITVTIRTKEEAHDYRYFPEPDLVPMRIADWVPRVEAELPELPDAKRERFVAEGIADDDHAKSLTSEIKVADFSEKVHYRLVVEPVELKMTFSDVVLKKRGKRAAALIADVLKGELNYRGLSIDSFSPDHMVEIVEMLEKGTITEKGAVEVIRTILDEGGNPAAIVAAKGLSRVEDDAVVAAVRAAVEESSQAVADYRAGNEKAINFIVGMVMKRTRGRADPGEANRLVKEALDGAGGA